MITTSTSIHNFNYLNQNSEGISNEAYNDLDSAFYESIKSELDQLKRNPEEETISRILAYSKSL